MCGRYASFLPAEATRRIFGTVNPLLNVRPPWNIAPTQEAMVVRRHPDSGNRHLDLLKCGLLPSWTKDPARARRPINARAETIASSGMFRRAFANRRCIVPADAFYEWRALAEGKQPYAIARQDGSPMGFAGLWEGFRWPDETVTRSFTIATTTANADVAALHDRMPVILGPADWPVSRDVNAPRNNRPEPGWWLEAECPCGRLTFIPLRLLPTSPIGAIAGRLRCRGCHGTPAVWLTD